MTVEYASLVDLSILLASLVCACARASPTALAKSLLSPEAVLSIPNCTMCPTAHPEAEAQATITLKAAAAKMAAKQAATSLLLTTRVVEVATAAEEVLRAVGLGAPSARAARAARCVGGAGGDAAAVVVVVAAFSSFVVVALHPSLADLAWARAREAATRAIKVRTAAKAMAI